MLKLIASLIFAFSLTLCSSQGGQEQTPPDTTFLMSKPDIIIRVKQSQVGSEYVYLQMLQENYPKDLLASQCEKIAVSAGSSIRGLNIMEESLGISPGGKEMTSIKGEFAMDYLTDSSQGILRLEPIAKAFAGAPAPNTIKTIAVIFEGYKQKPGVTVGSFENENVAVIGNVDETAGIVEYRIVLKSQNPGDISIPATIAEQTKDAQETSKNGSALGTWLRLGMVALAAVVFGLLVYFALRPRKKP